MTKREVFVLEQQGTPRRVDTVDGYLLENVAAGIRLGLPEGEERVVRYVPEPEPRAWILCSERMPEHGEPAWFLLTNGQVLPGLFGGVYWKEVNDHGGGGWHVTAVTNWMPRIVDEKPEPPA